MDVSMKCVMIMNEALPLGLAVNTAAVLALTLGKRVESILGPDVVDGSGQVHVGITTIPIPILKANEDVIKNIRMQASGIGGLLVVDFTDAAQTTTTYQDYTEKIAGMSANELNYLGIALYGEKKPINRLSGSLPLLR